MRNFLKRLPRPRTIPPRGHKQGFRPRLETLEAREVPAVITVVNTADSGTGSLRWAIQKANVNAGLDEIRFNIGTGGIRTVRLKSALPEITDAVFINASSQPRPAALAGRPVIELDGSGIAGAGVDGLRLRASAGGST